MRRLFLLSALALPAFPPTAVADSPATVTDTHPAVAGAIPGPAAVTYPTTATVDQSDVYHGVTVRDPYRWLEEDVRESPRVQQWVAAQNEVTSAYLAAIPERETIGRRLQQLWDYERFSTPVEEGGRYYYKHNDGLQNQSVVFAQERPDAEPRLLVDPNAWSADGTVALDDFQPSPDGRYAAMTVQDGGSDWRKVRLLALPEGTPLADELSWVKFSPIAWLPDGSGFYYSRFPEPPRGAELQANNFDHTVHFHRVGTPQSEDRVAYARPDHPEWLLLPEVTEDGRYLVVTIAEGTSPHYQIAVQDLAAGTAPRLLVEGFDDNYALAGNRGSELFFRTSKGAPRGRVVAIDLERPQTESWREVVPEGNGKDVLAWADLVGGRLAVGYLRDARSAVEIYSLAGAHERTVELPGIGDVSGFNGHQDSTETFYTFSSFNAPPTIYRYDVASGSSAVFKRPAVAFDPADYVVEQVFYSSKDGTRVPMFLAHRRDVTPNGERPTLLYGYGGFNVSVTPSFSTKVLGWMEMGGVYAVANLRGGGEYGEQWHQAGQKLRKQNVFDDFIAAAEHLVASGWTKPSRLAVNGGSNGGLLVGAVINQRPDLFAAAIPQVGVMDMLRFDSFTAGHYWVDDYGSAADPQEFKALHAYSPYHNVKPGGRYPAVLATTADRDDRVVPMHSFKYMAALQAAQAGEAPVLIRIDTRAGHSGSAGKATDKQIAEATDIWSFLVKTLRMQLPQRYGTASATPARAGTER